jgi:hypothetical protein
MPKRIDLEKLGKRGFVIEGATDGDEAFKIAAAGDVNGDGLDDILIGAPGAHLDDRGFFAQNGKAYLVYGKKDARSVHLSDLNGSFPSGLGFRIDGPYYRARAGQAVAGLGDINGDGLADLAVAGPFGGSVYVVFGKRDPLPVDLSLFEANAQGPLGYRIGTPTVESSALMSVAGAGDVNGDGVPDIVIGVIPDYGSAGATYVVWGKADPLPVDARALGDAGFRIDGPNGGSLAGQVVAGAGDVNGDGLGDVVIGSPAICCAHRSAYVIFGKPDPGTVRLGRLGRDGFEIRGAEYSDFVGIAVAGVGDIDGDGLDDVLVGAPSVRVGGRRGAGAAYVIYGKRNSKRVHLGSLGPSGYRIAGSREFGFVGNYVAGVGDIDGNGVPDFLVGAPDFARAPRAFLVWGRR